MGLGCLFSHSWIGCKCRKCGKTRNEGHDWSKDCETCATCDKSQTNVHDWAGCKCRKCGKTRNEGHDWSKDCLECSICGEKRIYGHNWYQDCEICSICGKIRDKEHEWSNCKCLKCGKVRDEEHNWLHDCQKCRKCGKVRDIQHDWHGCRCSNCIKINEDGHDWHGCRCTKCKKVRDEGHEWVGCSCNICFKRREDIIGHDWSKDCNKCSKCGYKHPLNFHTWVGGRCTKCGKTKEDGFNANDVKSKVNGKASYDYKQDCINSWNLLERFIKTSDDSEYAQPQVERLISEIRKKSMDCEVKVHIHQSFALGSFNIDITRSREVGISRDDESVHIVRDTDFGHYMIEIFYQGKRYSEHNGVNLSTCSQIFDTIKYFTTQKFTEN